MCDYTSPGRDCSTSTALKWVHDIHFDGGVALKMKKVFTELSPEELHSLEVALKKVGKRAAALMKQR